ncbi:MAG: tetratricopeptide repeat protein [Vicinamibacterales bacterium]
MIDAEERGGRRPLAEPSNRRRLGSICACTLTLLLLLISRPAAQQPSSVQAARQSADSALRSGKFDQVESVASAFPEDEALIVLRARAAIASGDYARAESLLQPPTSATPTGDAALELGLLQHYLGRRVEARRTLQPLLLGGGRETGGREYARAARAARALGRFEDANSYYRDAVAQSPNDPVINTGWGELFLEKHNRQDASRSFQAAIKSDPAYGPAQLGMARAVADDNPPAAAKFVQRALEINPSDVGAHLVVAELAIDEDRRDAARQAIERAQRINPRSLEAWALAAAVAFVEGNDAGYKDAIAAALELNPVYGEVHRVVGSVTAGYYRFEEAAEHVRRAIAQDRENARAHADLGAHLMRTGDERNARRALELAFRADPYNVITYNLLGLLDTLDAFETFRDGDLVLKLHPDESGVMREYAPALARQALDALSKRWAFTPTGPLLIEIFPRHDDFAVRNVGLPGMIGALGACFGRVVTMDSPKARPPGDFNWGATLWHEMAHVITLQLSNQRIPRWLTEGISVFEEKRARPEWGREMEVVFARALDRGEVLKLETLNAGFQNPQTISLAYYEASLLVEHIVETHGEPALRALVVSFADGIDTKAAIEKVLGLDLDAVQKSFDAFLDERFRALRAALVAPDDLGPDMPLDRVQALALQHAGSYAVQMSLGQALRSVDPQAAIQAFERASALIPMATGPESAQAQIFEVAMKLGDKARAARALEDLTTQNHTDLESARTLVGLLDPATERDRLKAALRKVVAVDPFDSSAHTTLGRMAVADRRSADAVRDFRVALAAGPTDRAAAHADLAEGLVLTGARDEAKTQALAALEIAPTYERAQELLLKLVEGGQ